MPMVEILPPGHTPSHRVASTIPKAQNRFLRWVAWALACAVVGLLIGTVAGVGQLAFGDAEPPPAPPAPRLVSLSAPPQPHRGSPAVYAYSVVPGGVHGADEAIAAAESDPVVAEHYRGIELAALRVTRVEKPRAVHVSYRIGDRVYWTKRKVQLQPGELVLSDGAAAVRTRCGNCVSDVPQGPTSDQEPPPEVFDRPVPTAGTTPRGGLAPLQAYDIFSNGGAMPPALAGSPFSPSGLLTSAGVPGAAGFGGPTFGGPAGFGGGGGGGGGGVAPSNASTTNRPATSGVGENPTPGSGDASGPPAGGAPPGLDGGSPQPPGGGTTPPPGGGNPPGGDTPPGGNPPPPGGGTTPGGDTPGPGGNPFILPPGDDVEPPGGGDTTPPGGGGTTPPGGGIVIPPQGPGGDGGSAERPEAVPEPGGLFLFAAGLSAFAARRLRRR